MSLIHEALKKAEQQRRLGQPPDLGTPFASTRRSRSSLPYLAAGIIIAAGAGWWLASDNATPAGSADGKPATAQTADNPASGSVVAPAAAQPVAPSAAGDAVASSSAMTRRPVMGANAQANTNVADSLLPPPRLNNQAPPAGNNPPTVKEVAERESEPHPPGANPLAPGEAAPLALGAPPPPTEVNDAAGVAAKMAAKERGGLATAPPAADPARSPRKPGPPPGSLAEANAPPPTLATANAPPKTTNTAPGTAKTPTAPPSLPPPNPAPAASNPGMPPAPAPPAPGATASAAPASAPGLEQLPAYWQLPYNMRKELPALKLSMHVYSATPTQRFVVLNGNRQVEGDELGGDVKVTEIRSDGVVLTYQGQRFLVPRGGS